MSYSCKILLDSISETGKRLTTFEITFPRIVLAEFNTHRMLSRNSASSRAIPLNKQIERITSHPFIPEKFPINSKGMQPQEYVTKNDNDYRNHEHRWLSIRDKVLDEVHQLQKDDFNWHKQVINRLLEPFMWHTVIVTATEFDNFFKLRTHPDAQYEIRRIADLMYEAYHTWDDKDLEKELICQNIVGAGIRMEWEAIRPQKLKVGEWHCPLVGGDEDEEQVRGYLISREKELYKLDDLNLDHFVLELKKKISVARCARVSYLTHDGKRDIEKDLDMFSNKLMGGDPIHSSPTEHVATPVHEEISQQTYKELKYILDHPEHPLHLTTKERAQIRALNGLYYLLPRIGNLYGWKQYRKEFADENCTNFRKEN